VTILNGENCVVAPLGDDGARVRADTKRQIRRDAKQWKPGRFIRPHDACFDRERILFVAEWVSSGRVTRLQRLT
jgi:hypothetical protein